MKVLFAVFIVAVVGGFIWIVNLPNDMAETSTELPVISRLDILHASDLADGVKLAVKQNDPDTIDDWLEKAIELAQVAKLSKEDINYFYNEATSYLSGDMRAKIQNRILNFSINEVTQWKTSHTNYTSQENRNIGQPKRGQLPRI